MNQLTTTEPVRQITIAPLVRCVDVHGDPVPEWERDIPEITPDPTDPADWPAWTDNWLYGTADDFDAALEADDASMPPPELPDVRDPHDWPSEAHLIAAEAPDGRHVALKMIDAGILPMPVAGGAPEPSEEDWLAACEMFREPGPYVPTDADLAEMHAHRDATECLYGYE